MQGGVSQDALHRGALGGDAAGAEVGMRPAHSGWSMRGHPCRVSGAKAWHGLEHPRVLFWGTLCQGCPGKSGAKVGARLACSMVLCTCITLTRWVEL